MQHAEETTKSYARATRHGNMTNDGNHTYFYDAEERLVQVDGTLGNCSTATACYLYDALGRRTTKTIGAAQTNYIYDLDGNVISEVDQNNVWMNAYPRMNGQLIAQYLIGSPRTQFILSDHLGSTRVLTKYDATIVDSLDFLPFGEQIAGGNITTHKFTGDERDSETNLDHTSFRQYSSQLGRWMHPDPAGLAAVDPSFPQSWNRYAYVVNSPLNLVDPLGLVCSGNAGDQDTPCNPANSGGGGGSGYFGGTTVFFDVYLPGGSFTYFTGLDFSGGDIFGADVITYIFITDGSFITNGGGNSGFGGQTGVAPYPFAGGGGGGIPGTGTPSVSPCQAQAQRAVDSELKTFAGYAGIRVVGRMGIGAAFGAAAGYRYLKYGGTWNMIAGAVAGAALGGAKNTWQDRNTIQKISTEHYMQQVQACVDKSLTPTAP